MKKYYDPKMSITEFGNESTLTVSGGINEWAEEYGNNVHTIEFTAMAPISNYVNMGE